MLLFRFRAMLPGPVTLLIATSRIQGLPGVAQW